MSNRVEPSKNFVNKKLYRRDFNNVDLSKSDFRGATAIECNFDGCEMSYADCEGANFFGSSFKDTGMYRVNLTDAIMSESILEPKEIYGVNISLVCGSFDNVKISDAAFLSFINFALKMQPKDQSIKTRLMELLGEDTLEKIRRLSAAR